MAPLSGLSRADLYVETGLDRRTSRERHVPFNWIKRIFSRDADALAPETITLPDAAADAAVQAPEAPVAGPIFESQRAAADEEALEAPESSNLTGRLRTLGVAPLWVPSLREPALLQRLAAEATLTDPASTSLDIQDARQRLDAWLTLEPSDAEALVLRGRAAALLGDSRAARADFEAAVDDAEVGAEARAALEALPTGEPTLETPAVEG